jgi:hypothetical protein
VLNSTSGGLNSEKKHLELELKESKEISKVYENKTNELMEQLNTTSQDL